MLLASGLDDHAAAALRQAMNRHGEETPVIVPDVAPLIERLPSARPELVVLGPGTDAPLEAAQRVRRADRDVGVVVLASPEAAPGLASQARFLPLQGRRVTVLPAGPRVLDEVHGALMQERRRGRHRATLAAMNAAAAEPGPVRRNAAEYLERLLHHAPLGILLVDEGGVVLAANPEAQRVLGLDEAAFPARLEHLLPETVRAEGDHGPLVVSRGQGEAARRFEVTVAVLSREAGARGRLVLLRDITERLLREEELRAARVALAQSEKLSALGSLVAGVAHEVRTPLAYIANHAEVLARAVERAAREGRPPDAAHARSLTASVVEGVDRINRLVQDLRRFTRLEPGRYEDARLDEVARAALQLYRAAQPASGDIIMHLEETPRLPMDTVRIQQVVLNLVQNAAEAVGGGGRVTLSTRTDDGDAVLVVKDDGPGIPEDALPRIFEPLFTTKSEGTGLGLSIVKRIVEEHGGTIAVETGPQGTTFTARFPRARPRDARLGGVPVK